MIYPRPITVTLASMNSGDCDLFKEDIPRFILMDSTIAGDWESGTITWVADRNKKTTLILWVVKYLVGESGGEVYGGNSLTFNQDSE